MKAEEQDGKSSACDRRSADDGGKAGNNLAKDMGKDTDENAAEELEEAISPQADGQTRREDVDKIDLTYFEVVPEDLELQERIGMGCTAEVYRGYVFVIKNGKYDKSAVVEIRGGFERVKREVAIKQIDWNKSRMGLKEQLAFDREVAIMPKTVHENLVEFIGVSSKQRPFRIITEFCSGGCCFELLHNSDDLVLVWGQQHKICLDVASAMDYLHRFEPQIIHRDLKSLNLLLAFSVKKATDMPLVKVSDFGLSRMKDQAPGADWGKMTVAAGTCHWMAPEVHVGSNYDEKVDVYSFAMILFEVICREIPFGDEEPAAVGRFTLQRQRPDMEAVPPDCPPRLRQLMIDCWAHDPKKRPAFDIVFKELKEILKDGLPKDTP